MNTNNQHKFSNLLAGIENIRLLPEALVLLYGVMLVGISMFVGTAKFSPDSWSYIELAKTFFGDEPYKFNTYRSYISDEYSAAFPFGYPIILAIMQAVLGPKLMLAVNINILTAVGTGLLIITNARKAKLNTLAQAALALSVLLYSPYMDEVLAGRSIPLAILLFVGAYGACVSSRYFLAGLLLGLAAITRFDFLVCALLFQAGVLLFSFPKLKLFGYTVAGFVVGIFPWIIYSETFFGRLWISDNSWVAISVTPSFVLDYPAAALTTLFDSPQLWLHRVIGNVPLLVQSLVSASLRYPFVILLLFMGIFQLVKKRDLQGRYFAILALASVSLAPYALTGYYDSRYFTLFFLVISVAIAVQLNNLKTAETNISKLALVGLMLTITWGVLSAARFVQYGAVSKEQVALEDRLIASLQICQKKQPEIRYIFTGKAQNLAAKYGAITGGRSAFIPSNFNFLNDEEKKKYFAKMAPFKIVDSIMEQDSCN